MSHRSLCALALVGALGVSAGAKPPDLPMNETNTVTPRVAPEVEEQVEPPLSGGAIVTEPEKCELPVPDAMAEFLRKSVGKAPGSLANDLRPVAHPLLTPLLIGAYLSSWGNQESDDEAWKQINKFKGLGEEELPPARTIYDVLPEALPTPAVYQMRPTARNTLAGAMLLGIHPLLALLPTERALDAPHDHPQKVAGDDVLGDMRSSGHLERPFQGEFVSARGCAEYHQFEKWLMSYWAARHAAPTPEEHEGYVRAINPAALASLTPVVTPSEEIDAPLVPAVEALPMPQEDVPADKTADSPTCPYLRQQALDRHARQIADPEIGREVLDNLERLTQADKLVELAGELARAGRLGEAMNCCSAAVDLCPGSPSADRAADLLMDLCFGPRQSVGEEEEAAEIENAPTGIEQQVQGLMQACRLLMSEGRHEQAAELARQAFALDPEYVLADPLLYKMHLLAGTPMTHPSGGSEASEPPSCPYCPTRGKPIREIVPDKKKSASGPTTFLVPSMPKVNYEVVPVHEERVRERIAGAVEASEEEERSSLDQWVESILGGPGKMLLGFGFGTDGGLRLCGECSCAGSVYHVLYSRSSLALWKTPDAAKIKP